MANTIEKVTDIDLNGNKIECAKLTITDTSIPFTMRNLMTSGKDYVFSLYLKNSNSSSISVYGTELTSEKTWTRKYVTFTATGIDLPIVFNSTGTYYFYNTQLETGKVCSDWAPNPQDTSDDIENVTSIAEQTADKFSWIVKSGTSSSNFELTDRTINLISENINLDGVVNFMNTAKGNGKRNLYETDYSNFENLSSNASDIYYAKDNGVTSVTIDNSVAYNKNKSLKVSYTTENLGSSTTALYLGNSKNNYGCVQVEGGKKYILSCYVKSDTSDSNLFLIDFQGHTKQDTSSGSLYLSKYDMRKLPGSSTYVNLSSTWQRAVCSVEISSSESKLYLSAVPVLVGKPNNSKSETFNVWIDCIMLEEVGSVDDQPSVYIEKQETVIDGGSILTNTITADALNTNSIMSRNYSLLDDGSVASGSFLNLGDGSFKSKYLNWDETGKITATGGVFTNVDITGKLIATGGQIGKFIIDGKDSYMKAGSGSTAAGMGGNQAFWAGGDSSESAPFRVSYGGQLVSSGATLINATVNGKMTATSGNIGGWIIDTDTIATSDYDGEHGIILDSKNRSIKSLYKTDSNVLFTRISSISSGEINVTREISGALTTSVKLSGGIHTIYKTKSTDTTETRVDIGTASESGILVYDQTWHDATSSEITNSTKITSSKIFASRYTFNAHTDNYITATIANGTANTYIYTSGYTSFYVNNKPILYVNSNGLSMPGEIGLYSSTMGGYVARYYVAGSTKSTSIGNNSYATRIYGSSVWANKAVSTSDERLKKDFNSLDKFEDLYMKLQPVSFKYVDGYDVSEDTYFGLKAQTTEQLFKDIGENPDDYAMFNKFGIDHEDIAKRLGHDVDFDEEYGLDYTNMIALNTHMIQKTRRELEELKQENKRLKQTIDKIMKQLVI